MKVTVGLLATALIIVISLYIFHPKNIQGPRVTPTMVKELQFPYSELNKALKVAFPNGESQPRYDLLRQNPKALDHYLSLISEIGPARHHRFTRREQRLAHMQSIRLAS